MGPAVNLLNTCRTNLFFHAGNVDGNQGPCATLWTPSACVLDAISACHAPGCASSPPRPNMPRTEHHQPARRAEQGIVRDKAPPQHACRKHNPLPPCNVPAAKFFDPCGLLSAEELGVTVLLKGQRPHWSTKCEGGDTFVGANLWRRDPGGKLRMSPVIARTIHAHQAMRNHHPIRPKPRACNPRKVLLAIGSPHDGILGFVAAKTARPGKAVVYRCPPREPDRGEHSHSGGRSSLAQPST